MILLTIHSLYISVIADWEQTVLDMVAWSNTCVQIVGFSRSSAMSALQCRFAHKRMIYHVLQPGTKRSAVDRLERCSAVAQSLQLVHEWG